MSLLRASPARRLRLLARLAQTELFKTRTPDTLTQRDVQCRHRAHARGIMGVLHRASVPHSASLTSAAVTKATASGTRGTHHMRTDTPICLMLTTHCRILVQGCTVHGSPLTLPLAKAHGHAKNLGNLPSTFALAVIAASHNARRAASAAAVCGSAHHLSMAHFIDSAGSLFRRGISSALRPATAWEVIYIFI